MQIERMEYVTSSLEKTTAVASASSECKTTLQLRKSSEAAAAVERYGSRKELFTTFCVDEQMRHASVPVRCILGKAPQLMVVNEAYGRDTAEEWLLYQVVNFCEFVGARDKLSRYQLTQVCRMIVQDYGWMKLTDIELFFTMMKHGEFGRFYGAVDPLLFMQGLRQYICRRNEILAEYYEEEERQRREREMQGAVTWEQYRADHPEIPETFEEYIKQLEEEKKKKEEAENE